MYSRHEHLSWIIQKSRKTMQIYPLENVDTCNVLLYAMSYTFFNLSFGLNVAQGPLSQAWP
jgi:hypothetical protein